jgi:potassium/hydrogen antiporter
VVFVCFARRLGAIIVCFGRNSDIMNLNLFFAMLGGLLVLAFVANRLVRFTGVPDVIILMFTGVLIGPVLHWIDPEIFRGATHGFGSLALMLILFEGGLDLKLREILSHFAGGFFLALFSYVLAAASVAFVCRYALQLGWVPALLVGAVLGCISSSIILPVLQQVNLRREVKVTLLVEASLGDALAVLAVTSLLDVAAGGSANPKMIAWSLVSSLILSIACGVLAGMLWSYLLPVLTDERFWHVLTFAAVLLVYSGTHALKGNELVAVLVFGLTLSNLRVVRKRLHIDEAPAASDWFSQVPIRGGPSGGGTAEHHHEQMLTFHGELAFLLRTFFFVLLGVLVEFSGLRKNVLLALGCFGALLIARWIAVECGRVAFRGFARREREIMVWFLPRGLITAVLGIDVLEARGGQFEFLPSLAFAVILLSNLVLLIGTFRARGLEPSQTPPAPDSLAPDTAAIG